MAGPRKESDNQPNKYAEAEYLRRRGDEAMQNEDSLAVTDIEDILDYLYSLDGLSSITKIDREKLKSLLESKMVNGVLTIPKEYGMFICKK